MSEELPGNEALVAAPRSAADVLGVTERRGISRRGTSDAFRHLKRGSVAVTPTDVAYSLLEEAAHRVPHPMLLVDPCGKLLFANRLGMRLMQANNGLALQAGRVRLRYVPRSLDTELIYELTGDREESLRRDGGYFRIRTTSRSHYHHVVVHQLSRRWPDGEEEPTICWLLQMFGEATGGSIDIDAICLTYRLSRAETVLVRQLHDGCSLSTAAHALRRSRNTVKTQLRNVYAKLGVRSQAQLVRAIAYGPRRVR
jgi:DNA-binding CsgD family transcriptional regulator